MDRKLTKRSNQPEWIDLGPPYYTLEQYENCLYQLDRVGRFLGGDQATFQAFEQLRETPASILDVGCGGGLFTMRLAKRYPLAQVTGIDLSHEAIRFANQHLSREKNLLPHVNFFVPASSELAYPPRSFDVVTATLVCHHLTDGELISFIKKAGQVAKQAVILNDLHRHPLATAGFAAVMPFLFPNRLVWHDGLLSIRRAFKRSDWIPLLKEAGIPLSRCSITWHWAFRWIVKIDTTPLSSLNNGS